MSLQHEEDVAHVESSVANALEALRDAENVLDQAQVDDVKDRAKYFENLTIGSGAAIAAIVSYLGAHTLYPKWILRSSLVSLVIVMLAALCRTWVSARFKVALKLHAYRSAQFEYQECKNTLSQLENPDGWLENLGPQLSEVHIGKQRRKVHRLRQLTKASELVCVIALGTAMISLVWLAIRNF
jgi:hypothetical protein